MIYLIDGQNIDRNKWEECISSDLNSPIYGNHWYLNATSPGWKALVLNDYEAVFPIPVRQKGPFSYVNHPLFIQKLGVFSKNGNQNSFEDFMNAIPKSYVGLKLRINNQPKSIAYSERRNLILKITSLEEMRSGFNQNTKRNLKKALKNHESNPTSMTVPDFLNLKRQNSTAKLTETQWSRLEALANAILEKGKGEILSIEREGNTEAAVLTAEWHNRIYYLFAASTEEGRKNAAPSRLVYHIIESNENSGRTLDFEGSMDDNIARFFAGFGAIEETYYQIEKGIFKFI